MTGRLLSPEEMLKIIWDVGVEAEKKGVMIDQKMRFDAIAQAQDAKTLESAVEFIKGKFELQGVEKVRQTISENLIPKSKRLKNEMP